MNGSMTKWMAGVVTAMALGGCGNEQCTKSGEHLADVVLAEAKAAGQPAAEDKRAELVKKTVEACNAEPPKKEHLDCALAAKSTADMKECEGVQEAAKKE